MRTSSCILVPFFQLLIDSLVAFAGGVFESRAVFDRYLAAAIGDQPCFLEDAGGNRDAGSASAQHVGNEFLSKRKGSIPHAVLAHEQPAGQSLFDLVKAI